MTRFKTFDTPHSHDAEWYKTRELADHINQPGHRPRLLQVRDYVLDIISTDQSLTICDFGCGNGGLLRELQKYAPGIEMWGYDLQPSNVEDAHAKGSLNISYSDFTKDAVRWPSIAIVTEVLEHLVDPDSLLIELLNNGVTKYIVASSPDYESPSYHAPFHLWVFNGDSYKEMFEDCGWEVTIFHRDYFQYIVAKNPNIE